MWPLFMNFVIITFTNIDFAYSISRDFLQRCKDYGVTDVEIPQNDESPSTVARAQSEQAKIANMVSQLLLDYCC